MGQFGRITRVADLPASRVLAGYVRRAMKINEQGIPAPRAARAAKPAPRVPADLASALRSNAEARAAFHSFSPSCKREYVEWITEAKRDDTRRRRLATALEWISEGKTRNWKHRRRASTGTLRRGHNKGASRGRQT
jgi:uncharacterized protein YdeI (YjbR/CyaY-like superfamily)